MEWSQLTYFKMVAQLEHMTKAADRLSISQPALSRSIAKLEEELGFPLFERKGKSLQLNRYGHIFLKHVEKALLELDTGKKVIQEMLDPDYGTVSIAFIHSLGPNLLPSLLGSFRLQHPFIEFKFSQNASHVMLEELADGAIDLCIFSSPYDENLIEAEPLFQEEIFAVSTEKHPLAARASISLKELAEEPLISLKKDYGLRVLLDQFFLEAGLTPRIAFEGDEIWTLVGLVEAGLGMALIPRVSGLNQYNVSFLPIDDYKCCRSVQLGWGRNRYLSPAAVKFKDFILHYFS
ncbi:MAG: LysR family transcriptional regulator [Sporomusaceae bacterium]|nr:LysR family transcriptional regulator [Sporomusaceae bacterium]